MDRQLGLYDSGFAANSTEIRDDIDRCVADEFSSIIKTAENNIELFLRIRRIEIADMFAQRGHKILKRWDGALFQ